MRRRGCLIGIGGILLSIVLCCGLGYFVALPRFHEAVEREVTTVLSTEVSQVMDQQIPDAGNASAGTYRMSLDELQQRITSGTDNLQVEGLVLRGEGEDIVLGFAVTDASAEYRFTPVATSGGELELTNMRGDGGIVEQVLAPEALGSAIENSVNSYLDANGLVLQDVAIEGDELVLVLVDA